MAKGNKKDGQASAEGSSVDADAVLEGVYDGRPYTEEVRDLAEKSVKPTDAVNEAYLDQILAEDHQSEAKAKVAIVEESPASEETPSGAALQKTAGIADDVKRGEAYQREKAARRHGYVPVDE